MTDKRIRLEFAVLLSALALFIFFIPFLTGQKQPAIQASVQQNMEFVREMAQKYQERHKRPPETLEILLDDARTHRYNKTLFNPILKAAGDINNRQIAVIYSESLYKSLGKNFKGMQHAGKTAYYQDGVRFAIYGHLAQGELLSVQGKPLVLTNK
ncbi:MAG: hypothetical protein ACO1RX_15695 [Candidatus Sericytochromatia bacterium]